MLVVLLMIVLAFCANINYMYEQLFNSFLEEVCGLCDGQCFFFLQVAILNANYMAARLGGHYDVLFRGTQGKQNGGSVTVDMFSIL